MSQRQFIVLCILATAFNGYLFLSAEGVFNLVSGLLCFLICGAITVRNVVDAIETEYPT